MPGTVETSDVEGSIHRLARRAVVIGMVMGLLGLVVLITRHTLDFVARSEPFDLDINLVGARQLVRGHDIYDAVASRADGIRNVSPAMKFAFRDTFNSFVGAPLVAAIHAPLTALHHADAVLLFRWFNLVAMIGALLLVVRTLPRPSRSAGAAVAFGAAALSYPLVIAFSLGQLHGLVMLGLALGIWGVSRDRLTVAGIGLGVAAMLKVSPILLIIYLVARGKRQVALPAAITACALAVASMAVGVPSATLAWVRDVLPQVSRGTLYISNQSLPAAIGRLGAGSHDVLVNASLGSLRYAGIVFALGGCGVIWWRSRARRDIRPLELGAVILVMVLAGPLSWHHYYAWTLIPIVLLCDVCAWAMLPTRRRRIALAACGVAIGLLALPIRHQPGELAGPVSARLRGSPYPMAALLLFAAAWMLLANSSARRGDTRTQAAVHDQDHTQSLIAPKQVMEVAVLQDAE
jgi:alpha-1,2-mannosyltransferase